MEVGGTYKGIVTSIKEYGAFVELNGGQQGLLHISELSHEPVCKMEECINYLPVFIYLKSNGFLTFWIFLISVMAGSFLHDINVGILENYSLVDRWFVVQLWVLALELHIIVALVKCMNMSRYPISLPWKCSMWLLENICNHFYHLSMSESMTCRIVDIFIETCLPIWMWKCGNGSIEKSLVSSISACF